jgi:hypothetical protein
MVKQSDLQKTGGGEEIDDDLSRELKLLRILARDVAENFILRREGNIETFLACLVTLPRKKIREKVPEWLRQVRSLKLKPQKGRLKDLKAIDQLIADLKATMLDTQEKKTRGTGKHSKRPAAPAPARAKKIAAQSRTVK